MSELGNLGSKYLKTNAGFESNPFEIGYMWNFVKNRKLVNTLCNLDSKFSKANEGFKISTFEIGYMQNFIKIRKFILFGPKHPKLGIWARDFQKPMSDLKSAPSK